MRETWTIVLLAISAFGVLRYFLYERRQWRISGLPAPRTGLMTVALLTALGCTTIPFLLSLDNFGRSIITGIANVNLTTIIPTNKNSTGFAFRRTSGNTDSKLIITSPDGVTIARPFESVSIFVDNEGSYYLQAPDMQIGPLSKIEERDVRLLNLPLRREIAEETTFSEDADVRG